MKKPSNQELEQILIDKFLEAFPKETTPPWIYNMINYDFRPNRKKRVLEFSAFLKTEEEDDENVFWEKQEDGTTRLARINPETGEKGYLISYDKVILVSIFEAQLPKSFKAEVIFKHNDLSSLKKEDYFK